MERQARARFRVIRVNRWSLALILVGVLALLLLPGSKEVPAATGVTGTVKQGVTILNRDFSGKTEDEARVMLAELQSDFGSEPVGAREDRDSAGISYVIPELYGYSLNVDLTWFRLAMAAEGSRVEPATTLLSANRRLADFPTSVIRQGNADKRAVSLLINVDWGERELANGLLPILKKRGVKATFFVSGQWAQKNAKLLERMAADGHEIATHGHKLTSGPKELAAQGRLHADIQKSVQTIHEITGVPVRYYAPHKSEVNAAIIKHAADLKLRTVLYSLDTIDWDNTTSAEVILSRMNKAKAGDLILLHPKPNTAQVMEQALINFQAKGLRVVTLTEMLSPEPDTPSGAWRPVDE